MLLLGNHGLFRHGATPYNVFSPTDITSLRSLSLTGEPYYYGDVVSNNVVLDPKEDYDSMRLPLGGRAWLFDGTNDFGTLGANIAAPGAYTISAWVKNNGSTGRTIVSNYSLAAQCDYLLELNRTVGKVTALANGATVAITSIGSITANAWTHVAVTKSGSTGNWTFRIYINGVLDNTVTTANNPDNSASCVFSVGRAGASAIAYYNGSLSDVRMYNVAKSGAEVLAIYNQASTPYTIDTTGLLAHYWCNEEAGTTGFDSSGNDNHLTLTNITPATFHASDTGVNYNPANNIGHSRGMSFVTTSYASRLTRATSGSVANLTVSCLVRTSSSGGFTFVSEATEASSNFGWSLFHSGVTFKLRVYVSATGTGVSKAYENPTPINDGLWHHIAFTFTNNSLKLYTDGVLVTPTIIQDDAVTTIFNSVSAFAIGARDVTGTPSANYAGQVSDVRVYSVEKTSGEIATIATGAADSAGLLAQYYGNDDVSGNRNNLTLTNGAAVISIPQDESDTTKSVTGSLLQFTGQAPYPVTIESACVRMDGSNDYGVPQSNFPVIASGAMYAIMKPDGGSALQYLINARDPNRMYFGLNGSNRIYVRLGDGVEFNHTVTESDWVKVGVSWSGGNYKVFRNGDIIFTGTYTGSVGGTTSTISSYNGVGSFFKGYASDIRIYNAAKSDAEMLAITNGNPDTTGLYAWWPMQEGGGLTSYDISGNGNHLNWTNITESTFWGTRNGGKTQDVDILYGGRWAGENRIAGSEALQSAPWLTSSSVGSITVTGDSTTAPDGSSRGCTLAYPAVSGGASYAVRYISYTDVSGYTTGAQYTLSIWLKGAVGGEEVWLMSVSGVTYLSQKCTLTTEWVRYSFTFTAQVLPYIMMGTDRRDATQTATPAQTFYAWGAQISASTEVLPYVRTYTAAQTSRSYVPGSPLGSYCVDTLDLVGVPGKFSNPYSIINMNPFTAAENNGRNFSTTYESLPCLTGNGTDNYVDLGSAIIPATGNYDLSLWYYHLTNDGNLRTIVTQTDDGSPANRTSISANASNGVGTSGSLSLQVNNAGTNYFVNLAALTSATWHFIRVTRVGDVFTITCQALGGNVITGSLTQAVTLYTGRNTWLFRNTPSFPFWNNGRIAYFTVTTGGVTREIPLTVGSGANLTLYTDGVESTLTNAIVGTLTNVWANRTPINIPSSKNAIRAISPRNSQFRRQAADGDDRFTAFGAPVTGSDLTNMITFTD